MRSTSSPSGRSTATRSTCSRTRSRHSAAIPASLCAYVAVKRGLAKDEGRSLPRSTFAGEIDASGLWTGEPARDGHLRSADFFDVGNHPTITLRGRFTERTGSDTFKAEVELTIRGVTRTVVLDVHSLGEWTTPFWLDDENKGDLRRLGLEATARINRHDFGVSWQDEIPGGGVVVSNEIELVLDIEALLLADLERTGAIEYYRAQPTT